MQGAGLTEHRQRVISRIAHVEDVALLDRIERMLEEHLAQAKLVPLREADVDAILQLLLESD